MASLIGAGISGIGSLVGSGKEAGAIEQAAKTQAQAAEYAANLQAQAEANSLNFTKNVYSNAQGYWSPYQTAGNTALQQLSTGTAAGGQFNSTPTAAQVMQNDPGYQFNLNQGLQAVQRAWAAGGGAGSGGGLAGAAQYATNYTTNAYQNAYNQFMATRQANYGNLANLAGLGATANQNLTSAGTGAASNVANTSLAGASAQGNYLTQGANATAAGLIGSSNVWGSNLSNLGNLAQQAYQQQMANQSSYNAAGAYQGLGMPGGSGPSYTLPNLGAYNDYSGNYGLNG